MKVSDFLKHFDRVPLDAEICFQGGLKFYRTKSRAPNLVQIEFKPQKPAPAAPLRRLTHARVIGRLSG
jgi:hypothetical protein